jgi:hypothetical protein
MIKTWRKFEGIHKIPQTGGSQTGDEIKKNGMKIVHKNKREDQTRIPT